MIIFADVLKGNRRGLDNVQKSPLDPLPKVGFIIQKKPKLHISHYVD
jgi:Holliday junction resolvase RusA-like endonuclease